MAEIKVITVQAGEEFLNALTKLLGSDVAAQVKTAVQEAVEGKEPKVEETPEEEYCEPEDVPPCCCGECSGEEEVEEEPEYEFGEQTGFTDDEEVYSKTFFVGGADALTVTIEDDGIHVYGVVYNEDGDVDYELNTTVAKAGAWGDPEAYFDPDTQELTVSLFPAAGKEIDITNWS